MAATPPPILAEPATDNRRLVLIAVAMTALLAVPIGISVGMSWVDLPWSNVEPAKAAPEWVNLPQVRATTVDGTVVKARVALDVPGAVAKNTIQRNTQQVGLLLEVSIAQQTREQIRRHARSPERLPRRRRRRSCRQVGRHPGFAGQAPVNIG